MTKKSLIFVFVIGISNVTLALPSVAGIDTPG